MPEQSYFNTELFDFLRQLKRHNDREWFAGNRERYQYLLVEPALRFIAEFAAPLAKLAPHFVADARPTRGSLFRIYRDTRFSSDKRPYKTHAGIRFAHESGKDVHGPVFYFHLEPDNCFAAAGVWHPDSRTLTRIRSAIAATPEQWKRATRRLELEGESLTRPEGLSARSSADRGPEAEGLHLVRAVEQRAGVRPQADARLYRGLPDDASSGRIHHPCAWDDVLRNLVCGSRKSTPNPGHNGKQLKNLLSCHRDRS